MSCDLFSLQLLESSESFVEQEASLPSDDHRRQQEQEDLDEDEYDLEDADIIPEASSLDDLAKLITVEEVCASSVFRFLLNLLKGDQSLQADIALLIKEKFWCPVL